MRLNKIKLSGFKSFVEPTTILFPGNCTGIIGPNGCGKSNVIDAVRWVMGESSARQLRGDSMEDVIFNGSAGRPAVSRASVDLIFDNSDHTLGGQYASYSEISVRREVTRDGQSQYFLNGSRCRRRDIADIFLGTGLGPRSYAIIEQGMISRIIEAKPEELRVYLEEAAGITKYKERRRETESRMRNTRDNLDRLNDLREEVEKQLNHLKRQADAAERYKELKQEERLRQTELLALRWQDLQQQVTQEQQALQAEQTRVEEILAQQRALELKIEQQRADQVTANENLNTVQAEYYRLGSEISRTEQSIQHQKQTLAQQQQDLASVTQTWEELQQHIAEDYNKLSTVNSAIADQQPALTTLKQAQQRSAEQLTAAETAMQDYQQRWEQSARDVAVGEQQCQVEQVRLEQLEQQDQRLKLRLEKLQQEQQQLTTEPLTKELTELNTKDADQQQQLQQQQQRLQQSREQVLAERNQLETLGKELNQQQHQLQALTGELSSLVALQRAALGNSQAEITDWLQQQQLAQQPRLAECIQAAPGSELAVESVLKHALKAICVDTLSDFTAALPKGELMLLEQSARPAQTTDSSNIELPKLVDSVTAEFSLNSLLAGVYLATDLTQALAWRTKLSDVESIITRQGIWLGANWLRLLQQSKEQDGVLLREQKIKQIRQQRDRLEQQVATLANALATARSNLQQYEQQRDTIQTELQQQQQQQMQTQSRIQTSAGQLKQLQNRQQELQREIQEINAQFEQDRILKNQTANDLAAHKQTLQQQLALREQLQQQRDSQRQQLQQARLQAQADRDALHEITVSIESMRSMKDSTDRALARMQQQFAQLQTRRETLLAALANNDEPIRELEQQLAVLLQQRVSAEQQLTAARSALEELENSLRQLTAERNQTEQQVQNLRQQLEQQRLAAEEQRVRCRTWHEQLTATDYDLDELLANIPKTASISDWQQQVEKLEQRIQRMGAINLAAIDEHREQSARKEYLDAQHTDLIEALDALEKAIGKIDRETRSRFKEIFDKVNTHIKDMFPRLFGGGQAYLEMTGDNLLNTGIAIMAKPPGKRIANIHLLSGGEKALTAVAMVFSIFQLNPAPFCMLDEVDAPLDEANVGRFNSLVQEMAKKVQFIVITHNKTTMATVEQLIGVTMREAGVSRIVAVDVDEAVKLAHEEAAS